MSSRERPSAPPSDAEAIGALADQLAAGIGSLRKAQLAREAATPRPAPKPSAKTSGPDPRTRPKAAALAKARARNAAPPDPSPPRVEPAKPRLSAAEQVRRRTAVVGFASGMLAGMLLLGLGLWVFTSVVGQPEPPGPAVTVAAMQPPEARSAPATALPPVGAEGPAREHAAAAPAPEQAMAPDLAGVGAAPLLVSVNASPWAEIAVDGRPIGETPIADLALEAGAHEFEATLPDGRVLRRTVDVRAGNTHVSFP